DSHDAPDGNRWFSSLLSGEAHLDVTHVPGTPSIVGQVEAVCEVIRRLDAVSLPAPRVGIFSEHYNVLAVYRDGAGGGVDLSSEEGPRNVQELDDPRLLGRVVLSKADTKIRTSVRPRGVALVGDYHSVQNVTADPRHAAELDDLSVCGL